jgi:hypothetical protein
MEATGLPVHLGGPVFCALYIALQRQLDGFAVGALSASAIEINFLIVGKPILITSNRPGHPSSPLTADAGEHAPHGGAPGPTFPRWSAAVLAGLMSFYSSVAPGHRWRTSVLARTVVTQLLHRETRGFTGKDNLL